MGKHFEGNKLFSPSCWLAVSQMRLLYGLNHFSDIWIESYNLNAASCQQPFIKLICHIGQKYFIASPFN